MLRRRALLLSALSSLGLVLCVLVQPVSAISTRSFVLDDMASLAAGELDDVAVFSDGHVETSVELRRLGLPDEVTIAWSAVRAPDGVIYVGTGDTGRIYRVSADAVTLFAETGQLLVTALALGEGGVLYAGTIPEGRIYAIDTTGASAGTPRELVRPADADGSHPAEHVWALVYDTGRHLLFAATGPEGRVYAIDRAGNASVYWDSTADHVMSLALDGGALYAGTSDDAIVVRLTAPGTAEVVGDFPGNEITALAFRDGVLAVGANEFPDPPAVPSTSSSSASRSSGTGAPPARPRPGKMRVYRVEAGGRAERVYHQDEGHVTRLELDADGTIYAGTGHEGRIVRISPDRTSAVWVDVDERQVLAMGLTEAEPYFVTSDGAALYRAGPGRPRTATWTSRVLDADFDSRWGALDWRGTGTLRFSTRSGGTARPDETWSDWSTETSTPGPIRSPANRFLQIRARFDGDPGAVLRAVTAYYLGENQRGVVSDVGLRATKRGGDADPDAPRAASPIVPLSWRIDNPDSDRMRYRLRYREESQTVWRSMFEDTETLTALEYSWDTSAVPDGWYVVEVEGSDELSNPLDRVLRSTSSSEPLLVDNHAPTVSVHASGARVSGEATDSLGPIARLELAIDGGEWRMIFPDDDLLDTARERFEIDLSTLGLAAGSHIVAVRAYDAGGNQTSAETTISIAGAAAPAPGGGGRRRGR